MAGRDTFPKIFIKITSISFKTKNKNTIQMNKYQFQKYKNIITIKQLLNIDITYDIYNNKDNNIR